MKINLKHWSIALIALAQAFFSLSASAAEAPIYTSFFSNKALDGYDTVAYFTEGKPVKGNKLYQTKYQGADWLFATQENLELFQQDPEKYAPQYGGYCAWALGENNELAPGDPNQWAIVDGKLYVNYDASIKAKWDANRSNLIMAADKNWPDVLNK